VAAKWLLAPPHDLRALRRCAAGPRLALTSAAQDAHRSLQAMSGASTTSDDAYTEKSEWVAPFLVPPTTGGVPGHWAGLGVRVPGTLAGTRA
jgi:hypothetical protein